LRLLAQLSSGLSGRVLKVEKPLPVENALVEAEIHDSSRRQPGANAPPALTFGLPGKQKVKPFRTGRFLISSVRSLAQNIKNFTY
jgi:hypothetical protein